MRSRIFNGLALTVSLSNHELVAVRRAHPEAMGNIVFQHPVTLERVRKSVKQFSDKTHDKTKS